MREVRPLYTAVSNAMMTCPIKPDDPHYRWLCEAKMLVDGFDPRVAHREAHEPGSMGPSDHQGNTSQGT